MNSFRHRFAIALPRLLIVVLAMFAIKPSHAADKPNLVLFLADDCTYRDIGCYGSVDSITPHIDGLAKQGLKFNKCYQAVALCAPTRQNLLTSVYPVRSGSYPNHCRPNDDVIGLPIYLKKLGYRVAHIGKWHLGSGQVFPFEGLGDKEKGQDSIDITKVDSFLADTKEDDKPFCLVVCSHQPHGPYTVGDRSLFDASSLTLTKNMVDSPSFRKKRVEYLAEVNFMDNQVGSVLEYLEKHFYVSNTLMIYLSEQGDGRPLSKATCYDDGVKSAFIARWPGVITPGTESEALVEYNDILPTFIEAAGGLVPDGLDGVSLMPIFEDPSLQGKEYAFSIHTTRGMIHGTDYFGIRSVTDGRYRLVYNLSPENKFLTTQLRNTKGGSFGDAIKASKLNPHFEKLVHLFRNREEFEFFDVENDPNCLENLIQDSKHAPRIEEMREALFAWMEYCNDEGVKTELLAFQRQPAKRSSIEPVLEMEIHPAKKSKAPKVPKQVSATQAFEGFIMIPRDGYYTFYKKRGTQTVLRVAGKEVLPKKGGATYGIIGLSKGLHSFSATPDKKKGMADMRWSGPEEKANSLFDKPKHLRQL